MGKTGAPWLAAAAILAVGAAVSTPPRAAADSGSKPEPQFERGARQVLEGRCRPCHFAGGKVYDRFPFDREDVVRRLGSARLFTRLKDEKDRAVLRAFLGEKPPR